MKNLLLVAMLFMSIAAIAQTTTELKEYTASNGHIFKPADIVQLGVGSNSNKDFVFIYTNPMSLTGKIQLGSAFAGMTITVKSIKEMTSKKIGKKTYLICAGGNIVNYYCDIEPAILTGEVIAK